MEDRELDNLLAKWAQEEIEVPSEVHEKTMQRIRKEARRQKIKQWRSLAAVAAVCCLCVPLAVVQSDGEKQAAVPEEAAMLMVARTEVTESKEMAADTVYTANAAMMKTESMNLTEDKDEKSVEEIWIERLSQLESDSKKLEAEKENYRQAPTPQTLAEINAETERLLKIVEEYELTLDPEYTALNLRLAAVKEQLAAQN